MKVFKFGGASVKDADGVKNVAKVLENQGFERCLLVISAIGKTTNHLEKVVELYKEKKDFQTQISWIEDYHLSIANDLFEKDHAIFQKISSFFSDIFQFLVRNFSDDYNYLYDQVVSCGEMISTIIVSEYLNEMGCENQWLDARAYIKTDSSYREAKVDWERTEKEITALDRSKNYITQGFIGYCDQGNTVTLGREGSDYSAAIFAYCLDADHMTIWKDVPGVMTGDPRIFKNVELLSYISYEEAIEMAYFGASVIHPKTLQPLQKKSIPFFVKSFLDPSKPGTQIGNSDKNQKLESYIVKKNQQLIRIFTKDFSFIAENHMSEIFSLLAKHNIKVSLMQNSAISLALCIEDSFNKLSDLIVQLQKSFRVEIKENLSLYTVRNINKESIEVFYKEKTIFLEQISRNTLQIVTESSSE